MEQDPPEPGNQEIVTPLSILSALDEETLRRAWGEKSPEERRRIVAAAIIFGEQFEKRVEEHPPGPGENGARRFLMALMGDVIQEFADRENMGRDEATSFLSDVGARDYVLEFNEVLEARAAEDSGRTLDEVFREAIDSRREKAVWSGHFSSG